MSAMSKTSTIISEHTLNALGPMIQVTRFYGLFPYRIITRKSLRSVQWSPLIALYSCVIGLIFGVFTFRAMIIDATAGKKSIRMKKDTQKWVTCGDISIITILALTGFVGSVFRKSCLVTFINGLTEIDTIINRPVNKANRTKSTFRIAALLSIFSLILIIDIAKWIQITDRFVAKGIFFKLYGPFYLCYYAVILLEYQYWCLVKCIMIRIQVLIKRLQINDTLESPLDFKVNLAESTFHYYDTKTSKVQNFPKKIAFNPKLMFVRNEHGISILSEQDVIRLSYTYLRICDLADTLNRCYGFPILVILISCLLHLTVTPYSMLLELGGRKDPVFLTLQLMWLLTHFLRLIAIIEPCHICTSENNKLRALVNKLCFIQVDDNIKKSLWNFAAHLQNRQVKFTACDFVDINRSLLTAITGAATTYLVILIQID